MLVKHLIVTCAAVMAITLTGALCAQTAADEVTAAQEYKRMKVDEATAADDKFHANRTQANMIARDKAEAEAAAAIEKAHAVMDRAGAARQSGAQAGGPR